MSVRFNLKRDLNDAEIYDALMEAYCHPIRGRDADLYARHVDGYGLLLEVKDPKRRNNLRPIQKALKELFRERYHVVCSSEEALKACGVRA